MLYNCSRNYVFSRLVRFLSFEIFPFLTKSARTLKSTMLNKSGYFRTAASMKESTALDFWRKSKKPEMQSYIIDHDFRKIQVENTAFNWILPYIWLEFIVGPFFLLRMSRNWMYHFGSTRPKNQKIIYLKVVPCFSDIGTPHTKWNPHET